jgi:FOG: Ankyrin repeat
VVSVSVLRKKVNHKTLFGWTPLLAATFHGQVDMVEMLMTNFADMNHRDPHGEALRKSRREPRCRPRGFSELVLVENPSRVRGEPPRRVIV